MRRRADNLFRGIERVSGAGGALRGDIIADAIDRGFQRASPTPF
ncbi:hypothetical protein A33M_2638 [Rhodovulum sp. PH10]|nr:hypothetical protein [Rhodovulum sp. PH10]EJW11857.1 hypothetical protein A33M_2638 [Rhodovulum sp. PH10]